MLDVTEPVYHKSYSFGFQTIMNTVTLSLALMNLLLGILVTILLKDRVDRDAVETTVKQERDFERRLAPSVLSTDFSYFEGSWYNCLHNTLSTFEGITEEKLTVNRVPCDFGIVGNITKIKENDQALQFDIYQLNRCIFRGFGGQGQKPCPNDTLPGDPRGDGNVLVKHSFKGVGSFTDENKVEFFSDHSLTRDKKGEWKANLEQAKIENEDTLVCKKHLDGIVCDWRVNEYLTSEVQDNKGCKKDGECKPALSRMKCSSAGGEWVDECPRIKFVKDGFVHNSIGSYYLVKDIAQCYVDCSDEGTESEDSPIPLF